jgi:BspA type Leucine rich repeat region (6 copies)/Cadherin-like beta sandwich domain/Abnormal spindle-like microcephaly-assoc'd, ASPM-SPD-2-Hydin
VDGFQGEKRLIMVKSRVTSAQSLPANPEIHQTSKNRHFSFPASIPVTLCQSFRSIRTRLRIGNIHVAVLASLLFTLGTKAQDFAYTVSEGVATITSYTGTDATITIPTMVDTFVVRGIGDYALQNNSTLTSVVIPSGIFVIGEGAFLGCTGLTTTNIPNSVTSVGADAFRDCSGLATVTLGSGVSSIGIGAFANCSNLNSITAAVTNEFYSSQDGVLFDKLKTQLIQYPPIKSGSYVVPSTVTHIGPYAFQGSVNGFTSVTLPASLTGIDFYAFSDCKLLTSIVIPNNVQTIGTFAFNNCTGITSINIGSGTNDIGGKAFLGCYGLIDITVDSLNQSYCSLNGVLFNELQTTLIQYPALRVGRYVVPDGVTNIEPYAFDTAINLTSINLPSGLNLLGDSAFYGCTSLTSVAIPSSVTRIREYTFADCTKLSSVTIGNSVTEIEQYAFSGCIQVTGATFGTGLTRIERNAFSNCSSLLRATFLGNAPALGVSVFASVAGGFAVTYPTLSSGFTTPLWNGYASAPTSLAPPEISVEQPAATILNSGASTVTFAPILVNSTRINTFTIRNLGNRVLHDMIASKDGQNAAEFTISSVATSVNGAASTTFTVTFQPAAVGIRSAVLHLSSNDLDENPFVVQLSGEGLAPSISVEQLPNNTPLVDAVSTVDYGSVSLNSPQVISFTIRNTGTSNLTSLVVSKSGTHSGEFTVGSLGATTVVAGGTTTFTVSFSPTATGVRTAAISIASNVIGSLNPFTCNLTGSGIAPEIAIELENGGNLADSAASVSHGSTLVGTQLFRTYTIRNTGLGNLTGLVVTKSGTHNADFTVTVAPTAPVTTGNFTVVTVGFIPSSTGLRTAAIQIANNDTNENPYDINLSGTGIAPDISIEQGTVLADGTSTVAYGSSNIATGVARTFTVRNPGSANLFNLVTTIDGANASDFTVTTTPASPVLPAGFTTFTVTFNPLALGVRTATLRVASNVVGMKNPFDINLSGTGVSPEISVEQPTNTLLTDGVSTSVFASTVVNATTVNTFTIRNLGTSTLSNISITKDGANPADFTVGAVATSVNAGSNTTFTVTFVPSAAGVRSATIRIINNDLDENPFDILLSGTGIAPDIALELSPNNTPLIDGVSTVTFDIVPINTTKVSSFTIRNSGTSNLTGLAITKSGTNNAEFTVGVLGATTLAPGITTSFTISFRPTATGARTAAIAIASNVVGTKNPFSINLNGGLSSDARLSALSVSAGTLSPVFSSGTNNYTSSVDSLTNSINLTPTILAAGATVRINGVLVASGTPSAAIPLVIGANAINTEVTAADGVTKLTYSLIVTKIDPYGSWAVAQGLVPGNSARLDNPDHDGSSNLLEYAFGTDPLSGQSGALMFTGNVVTQPGTPIIQFSPGPVHTGVFIRRINHVSAGLTYTTQFSSDLTAWSDSSDIPTVLANDGAMQAVAVPYPPGKNFFRVFVNLSDPGSLGGLSLLEYAFGADPLSGHAGALILNGNSITQLGTPITQVSPGPVYSGVFIRRLDYLSAGLTYKPQFSSNLIDWVDSTDIPTVLANDGVVQAVAVPLPADGRFFRVSVSLP